MIVVAIIGILAAIAIPAYQDYITKAQASEGFALLDGFKTSIAESFGQDNSATGCTTAVLAGAVSTGKYVASTAMDSSTAGVCKVQVIYGASLNSKIAGLKAQLDFTAATGAWDCHSDIDASVKPKACAGSTVFP
jgi:type IV pilus assembly protein PilA